MCAPACAEGLDLLFLLQPGQEPTDQIQTDTGTGGLQISDTKNADLPINGGEHGFGLFATRRSEVADVLLELLARLREDEEQEIHGRPRVVFAFVPALGALFEDLVVALFVVLNDAFETDVASGFEAQW